MDYNRIAANVARKLAKYGQLVALHSYPSSVAFDPDTLKATRSEAVVTNRRALTTDQPSSRIGPQYGSNDRPGTMISQSQKWIYLDALGVAPKTNDVIVIQGEKFVVKDVQVTAPGGVPLLYLVVLYK